MNYGENIYEILKRERLRIFNAQNTEYFTTKIHRSFMHNRSGTVKHISISAGSKPKLEPSGIGGCCGAFDFGKGEMKHGNEKTNG